jgi:hypothetical protein
MRRILILILIGGPAIVGAPRIAAAHKPSDSYLTLRVDGSRIEGRWDIAVRDLHHAIGLDADGDGEITWGELRGQHDSIARYALGRLTLGGTAPCTVQAGDQKVIAHSDGAYTVLAFTASCPSEIRTLNAGYSLFFDVDPQHRGLVRVDAGGATQTVIFHAGDSPAAVTPARTSALAQLATYVREGVLHIWIGIDHIFFLLALLLPSVLARRANRWEGAERLRPVIKDVLKVVTAFTIAHSLTLAISVLGWVQLPSRVTETAIAVSVALAALLNLFPAVGQTSSRWAVAFGLGLLHGFGFSSVLADLGLPARHLGTALVGFNAGVELGQLAIVAAFVPLAFLLRRSWGYRRLVLVGGSLAIASLALVWSVQRLG